MKKKYFSAIIVILINVIPSFTFAVTNDKGLDMGAYTTFAGYGFLILGVIKFSTSR